jgi:glucose 1-dehydrogenase
MIRAITVIPGQAGSARLDEVDEPPPEAGALLVQAVAMGVCGTYGEIVRANTAGRRLDAIA